MGDQVGVGDGPGRGHQAGGHPHAALKALRVLGSLREAGLRQRPKQLQAIEMCACPWKSHVDVEQAMMVPPCFEQVLAAMRTHCTCSKLLSQKASKRMIAATVERPVACPVGDGQQPLRLHAGIHTPPLCQRRAPLHTVAAAGARAGHAYVAQEQVPPCCSAMQ